MKVSGETKKHTPMKTTTQGNRTVQMIRVFAAGMLLAATTTVNAQITESMGTVTSTTSIATHETANAFDNDLLTYSGTGDVRNTLPSTGYTSASGGANIFLNTTRVFQICDINTGACTGTPNQLTFGIHKSTNASNGSQLIVEYSTDGGSTWTGMSYPALPTGSGTAIWHRRTTTTTLPVNCDLCVRFRNSAIGSNGPQFRIDDVRLTCGRAGEATDCQASVTADGSLSFCEGGSVTLTASAADSYLWSNGETTQSIVVTESGTYNVTTTTGECCVGFSAFVNVRVIANPVLVISPAADTITNCPGDSARFSVRTLSADLIISQYVEGSGFEKYLEIYNNTGATVNLADYEIRAYHNGACDNNSPTFTIALSGTLADQTAYVVANSSALLYTTADLYVSGLQFNGDDAVALYNEVSSTYSDIFGSICNDPGSSWNDTTFNTENRTLTRKACVYSGITINPNLAGATGFPTLYTEWIQDTTNVIAGLGSHTVEALSYSWSPATVPATGASVAAKPSVATTYTVTGTYCNGCPGSVSASVVVTECVGGRLAAVNNTTVSSLVAFPNPFTSQLSIQITMNETASAQVELLDMNGRVVRVLNNGTLGAGTHQFVIDGTDANGQQLAAGVYAVRSVVNGKAQHLTIVKSNN
jgi:flagellar hook assembly protein FlgD